MEQITRSKDTEILISRQDDQDYIMGYGAVWYDGTAATEYVTPDGYTERIDPTAFDHTLTTGEPIESRFNHDRNFVLGRSDLGTARFYKDGKGLVYQVRYDAEDPDHAKVKSKIKKGLIRGSSFMGFTDPTKIKIKKEKDKTVITHTRIDLVEAGPVDFPAFKGTEADIKNNTIQRMVAEYEEKELRRKKTDEILDFISNLK